MSYTDDFLKALEEEEKKKKKKKNGSVTLSPASSGDSYSDEFFNELQTLSEKTADVDNSFLPTSGRFSDDDDIAPVREDNSLLDFFDAGALKSWGDGKVDWDDMSALPKAILGTVGDVGVGAAKGFFGFAEGIADTVGYGIYSARKALGDSGYDLERYKRDIAESTADKVFGGAEEYLDKYSVLGDTSNAVAQGIGQVGAMIGTGGFLGSAAGLGSMGTSLVTNGILGVSSLGSGMSEAYSGGATDGEALGYGAMSAGAEIFFESLFGGLGKAVNAVGFNKGLLPLDDMAAKAVSKFAKSQTGKNIAEALVKSGFEGLEEVGAGWTQALAKSLTYMSEKDFGEILEDENLFEQFVVAMLTSGITQAGDVNNASKSGRDFVTGNTQNEQAVIDKEVADRIAEAEKDGKKLSGKEKTKIQEEVVRDMERGYISTDTIEEVLGGDDYTSYKDAIAKEDAIIKEFDELKGKQNATLEEQARFRELRREYYRLQSEQGKANRTDLRKKLSQTVFDRVKGDRLVESYLERTRVGEDFQADFSKYEKSKYAEAARATIQSAIDARANNSNRVHDLVDMAAQISADTGRVVTFKSGEQITNDFIERQTKEIAKLEAIESPTPEQIKKLDSLRDTLAKVKSGEVIVDGDITSSGIVLNLDSAKPLNRVVGHEITHSFEPGKGKESKEYTALRDHLFAYAKTKGVDIDQEIETRRLKYEGITDADPEAELVADLVGDYLFTDNDFISNLAVKNRNVFQKIWDDIKYMCKIATAGSKEARELERVKKAFEDAYRESAKNSEAHEAGDTETKYSIREAEPPKETGVAYKVFFVKDGKLYPPMVANPEGADTPMGVWLDADVGTSAPPSKTGRAQVKAGGKGTQGGGGSLAFRPGWHLGDLPRASQFDRVNPETGKKELFPENFVWAEVEYAKDVDYQEEAMSYGYTDNGKFRHAYAGLPRLPENGYYRYRTNPKPDTVPWIITGAMKVNRLLSDAEVNQILEQNGVAPVHRQGGDVGLDKFGFDESGNATAMNGSEAVRYSLSNDTAHMDKAIEKNTSSFFVDSDVMDEAKAVRARIASRMNEIKDKGLVGLPEDVEGNTYIANSSYDGTEENTTICPRSLASEAFVDAVSEYLGRPLTVEEQIYISQDLQGRSLTPECTYCYVATDRKAYRAFLGEYIAQRDAVLQKLKDNPNADVSRNGDLYKEFLNGRKDTKPMYSRFKMWVTAYKNGTPMVEASHLANVNKLMGDINSEFGAELKPQITDAMKYAQSASWAKKRVSYVAYNGHILKWKQDRIDKLNSHYGLRMYSFSDFHPAFVLENMQMITDASVRGLKMLGYTKDIDFVEIFAPSGMNINVSTFGFETDGNVYENNIIGAEWEKAKALREQYPNVGVTFVATNDTLVNWALEQDWIDVIIPYHLVRTGAEVAKAFNYTNYTSESADTKGVGWTKGDQKYIAPTEHNNDKATYMAALEKNHLKPRFERFIDHPNYMKLVNECRQPASQSSPVQPIFNEDAAMTALAKLEANGYYQPIGGSVDRMYEIAAEVAENMTRDLAPTKYSLSDSDGRQLSSEQAEYFKDSKVRDDKGNLLTVYHTTDADFTVFDKSKRGEATGDSNTYMGFFFADDAEYLRNFPEFQNGKTSAYYLNMKNPIDMTNISKEAFLDIVDVLDGNLYVAETVYEETKQQNGSEPVHLVNMLRASGVDTTYSKFVEELKPHYDELMSRGYDGVINYLHKSRGLREYIVLDSNQAKLTSNTNPTSNPDIRMSLSAEGEQIAPIGKNDLFGRDFRKKSADDIAPVAETAVPSNATVENGVDSVDIAPVAETVDAETPVAETADVETPTETTGSGRKALHAKIVNGIKSKFAEKGFDFDEVLKRAKNLSTFSTVDNTPQRVMDKTLGYEEGHILSDLTVNQVAQNETEGIKWLNKVTNRRDGLLAQLSKQYKIKPGSKESAAAQMYAEGFFVDENNDIVAYGDAELAQDFPDVRVQNNIKGLARDPRVRQFYDETLAMINESRTRNAYPEIPRLDNYYLHFRAMDDTFSRMGVPFNPNDIRAKDLPTDLNGVTADTKPGQPYFASAMHREGKRTSFDLLGGLERYATSAKNQIFHIDDIQTLRALRNYIADTYGQAHGLDDLDNLSDAEQQERIEEVFDSHLSTFAKFLHEEANVLAGKTSLIDRGVEGIVGRRAITFLDSVRKQVGSNLIGYSASSPLTNFDSVFRAVAKSNKGDFVKAFAQFTSNKARSVFGKSDGFMENNPTAIRRKGADRFYRTPFQKAGDAGYMLMGMVDNISTELIVRTKYNELIRKGMNEQEAVIETDKWASRLMGDRSLGQQPLLFNSKTLGLITQFQLEVRNNLDSMFYDTIQEAKVSNKDIVNAHERNAKTAAKITSTMVQTAVAMHLFGTAFEAVAGYNPSFDIIDVLLKAFGFDDEEEEPVLDNIEEAFRALLDDLPYTSTLTGGRIPISNALPITELITGKDQYGNEKSRLETFGEALPYYLLPGGYGQIKKTAQGLDMFSDEHPVAGSYTKTNAFEDGYQFGDVLDTILGTSNDGGNLRFPVEETFGNVLQAGLFGQYASENARDYFDDGRSPLKEKQIQEFIDVDIPIRDYWEYREGLADQKTIEDKFDYIAGLDLPVAKKNILINNVVEREENVDLEGYEDFSGYDEFDFATKNPGKYAVSQAVGGFEAYSSYMDALGDIEADKDENGKSISGSKKEKVAAYINSLDIDYGMKIILYKSMYDSKEDRNNYNAEIVAYLDSREDISYEDMVTILTELGMKVSGNNVYWD